MRAVYREAGCRARTPPAPAGTNEQVGVGTEVKSVNRLKSHGLADYWAQQVALLNLIARAGC